MKSVVENRPEFRLTEGKMVIEVRPSMEWNKGDALNYLLHTLGLSNANDVVSLYIGDDQTDEDAFKVSVFVFIKIFVCLTHSNYEYLEMVFTGDSR